eukprot:9475131-Pyramimonas_sp.AAC.1
MEAFMRITSNILNWRLEKGKDDKMSGYAEQIGANTLLGDHRQAWQAAKKILRCGGREHPRFSNGKFLPYRKDDDGKVITSEEGMGENRMRVYSKLEDAKVVSAQKYVDAYGKFPSTALGDVQLNIEMLPHLADTEYRLSRGPRRRAAGTDGLLEEILHAAPKQIAKLVNPLLVKVCATGKEPIAFKHSRLGEVSKSAGDPSTNKAFRAVAICNVFGKHHYRFLRRQLAYTLDFMLRDSQIGGRPRRSPVMASQQARMITQLAATKSGISGIYIFRSQGGVSSHYTSDG